MKEEKVIRNHQNYVNKMDVFYVAIALDKGQEAAIAYVDTTKVVTVVKAMVGSTNRDLESIKKACQECADDSGNTVQILKFTHRDVIAEYLPREK